MKEEFKKIVNPSGLHLSNEVTELIDTSYSDLTKYRTLADWVDTDFVTDTRNIAKTTVNGLTYVIIPELQALEAELTHFKQALENITNDCDYAPTEFAIGENKDVCASIQSTGEGKQFKKWRWNNSTEKYEACLGRNCEANILDIYDINQWNIYHNSHDGNANMVYSDKQIHELRSRSALLKNSGLKIIAKLKAVIDEEDNIAGGKLPVGSNVVSGSTCDSVWCAMTAKLSNKIGNLSTEMSIHINKISKQAILEGEKDTKGTALHKRRAAMGSLVTAACALEERKFKTNWVNNSLDPLLNKLKGDYITLQSTVSEAKAHETTITNLTQEMTPIQTLVKNMTSLSTNLSLLGDDVLSKHNKLNDMVTKYVWEDDFTDFERYQKLKEAMGVGFIRVNKLSKHYDAINFVMLEMDSAFSGYVEGKGVPFGDHSKYEKDYEFIDCTAGGSTKFDLGDFASQAQKTKTQKLGYYDADGKEATVTALNGIISNGHTKDNDRYVSTIIKPDGNNYLKHLTKGGSSGLYNMYSGSSATHACSSRSYVNFLKWDSGETRDWSAEHFSCISATGERDKRDQLQTINLNETLDAYIWLSDAIYEKTLPDSALRDNTEQTLQCDNGWDVITGFIFESGETAPHFRKKDDDYIQGIQCRVGLLMPFTKQISSS
jgi:hypothetical protein